MDINYYIKKFEAATNKLDKKLLRQQQIELAVGVFFDSVFLKLYKKEWSDPSHDALTAPSRIFFSIWINDKSIAEEKLLYNIHALKLRLLPGYKIESRKFAVTFRKDFKKYEKHWPNVSVDFGPLTLMEGWVKFDEENFQNDILKLSNQFLAIEHLIDNTLAQYKK
ncbi:MAG: hypothetical protein WDM90_22350 [Ferruginibacter sp.]